LAKQAVAKVDELEPDSMKYVVVAGVPVCVVRTEDGGFHAINDVCTHEDFSLSDGELWGYEVECPQHGSRFDVRTGVVRGLPAVIPAKVYPVSVEDGEVYVEVPAA
jgi:3-phenylpropionate/trans-cinnamate dioxygenase ferredoxin subunit